MVSSTRASECICVTSPNLKSGVGHMFETQIWCARVDPGSGCTRNLTQMTLSYSSIQSRSMTRTAPMLIHPRSSRIRENPLSKRRRDVVPLSTEEVDANKRSNVTVTEDVWGSTGLFDDRLVVSNMTTHSARILCEHENSFGPDFVSIREQLYCDMSQKSLYNLCSTGKKSCCFDLEQNTLKSCVGNVRGMTNARVLSWNSTKSYGNV